MATSKRNQLPKLDLSKHEGNDRLPGNVVSIIKNALVIYEGDSKKVAKNYNLNIETVNMVLEENYLQIQQIISSQMKSKELDIGINNAVSLITGHINSLQEKKTDDLMTKQTITDVTRMTDRMISLKDQYNKTYDTLVTKMHELSLKERAIQVQESGKVEDNSEYNNNQQIVANMMKNYLENKSEKKVTLVNVKTYEVKVFEGERARIEAENFLGCPNHLSDVARQKKPYKDEWLIQYEKGDS